jgi:hypothetical protein
MVLPGHPDLTPWSTQPLNELAGAVALGATQTRTVTKARPANRTAAPALPEAQYGGELFESASRYLRGVASSSGRARLRHTVRPRGFAASARLFAKLEHLTVSPTDSPSGRAIRAYLEERRYGIPTHRVAQGVLVVPHSSQVYLRGRHKQAVRTNLHRARHERLSCAQLVSLSEREAFANLTDPGFTDSWERELLVGRSECERWAVYDAESQPIGLSAVSVDSDVALIWSLVCRGHSGRWLLHTEIVSEMAKRGVRYLLVATQMTPVLPPGLQYFQRLLGHQVAHLNLRAHREPAAAIAMTRLSLIM